MTAITSSSLPNQSTTTTTMRSALSGPSSSKCIPKRAVSFSKACKYDPPQRARRCPSDEAVQATDNRRRYQRRGSKTPAMLLLSRADLALIQERRPSLSTSGHVATAIIESINVQTTAPRRMSGAATAAVDGSLSQRRLSGTAAFVERRAQQRRMSIMTALKINLESTLILETPVAVVNTMRRMSMEPSRGYTLEVLSRS